MKVKSFPAIGRPRGFDPDVALERAMHVFWRKGYEAASVADLTTAMGINPPSLYAAFGNKQALFRKVIERYTSGPAAYVADALGAPTAREVAERRLRGAVDLACDPTRPWGCMAVQAMVAGGGEENEDLRREMANFCRQSQRDLEARFERAKGEGDLPEDADSDALARFVNALAQGISVQASSGAGREELLRMVDAALASWPAPRKRRVVKKGR